MKYLVIILLTLGCTNPFKSNSKKYLSVNTYLHNDRYISIIQDPFSELETLNEYEFRNHLKYYKNNIDLTKTAVQYNPFSKLKALNENEFRNHLKYYNNIDLTKIAVQYKSLDIKNLEDIVKEIFGNSIIELKSNVYQCKKGDINCYIVIIYDVLYRKCKQLSSVEEIEKELENLKNTIKINRVPLYITNNLNTYKVLTEKAEKLFKN